MLLRVTAKYTHDSHSQTAKEREKGRKSGAKSRTYNGISHQCAGRMSAAISWPQRQTGSGVTLLVVGQVANGTLKVMPKNDIKRIARRARVPKKESESERERVRERASKVAQLRVALRQSLKFMKTMRKRKSSQQQMLHQTPIILMTHAHPHTNPHTHTPTHILSQRGCR